MISYFRHVIIGAGSSRLKYCLFTNLIFYSLSCYRWKGLSLEEGFEEIKDVPRNKYFQGPFQTPKTQLFDQYCEYLIDAYDLRNKVVKGEVTAIEPISEAYDAHDDVKMFRIVLGCGGVIFSKRVVLSIGHCNQKRVPLWVEESDGDEQLQTQPIHVWDLVHNEAQNASLEGKELMIVGGGLTSVQLVEAGLRQGASHVYLLVRGDVKLRQFDSNLLWSGRLRHEKLSLFWAESSMQKRLETISKVRQGGTMPVEARQRLEELTSSGCCTVREYTEVWEANWSLDDEAFEILLNDDTQVKIEALWLATGSEVNVENEEILKAVIESKPINLVSGYPCLQQDLRWASGWDLFIIGAYAALQIGPDAVNLSGARRAGFSVANSIRSSLESQM